MDILISNGPYGFGKTWQLSAYGKVFYLGQDSKFCARALGRTGREVINEIGTDRLDTANGRKKLAQFICRQLNVTRANVNSIEAWDLSAE